MEETLIQFTNLERVLNEYGDAVKNLYKQNLLISDRKDSGELINSVEYIYTHNGKSFSVSLKLADYWKYVEYDTKPHFRPTSEKLKWIKVKPELPTEKQLAFLIARKKSEVGTKGSHDLANTLEAINAQYETKIIDALNEDLDKGFGLIIHMSLV